MTKGDIVGLNRKIPPGHVAGEAFAYQPESVLLARLGRGIERFVYFGLLLLVVFVLHRRAAQSGRLGQ